MLQYSFDLETLNQEYNETDIISFRFQQAVKVLNLLKVIVETRHITEGVRNQIIN